MRWVFGSGGEIRTPVAGFGDQSIATIRHRNKRLGVILPENRSPIRLWDSRVNPRLMLRIVKRRPRLFLAEETGVEPA